MIIGSNWKRKVTGIVSFIIFVAIFIFIIHYLHGKEDIVNGVIQADRSLFVIGIITTILSVVFSGVMDVTCAKAYGLKINYLDAIFFSYIASAINIVFPFQMGSFVKMVYYKKKSSFSYSKYISVMAGTMMLHAMIVFIIICLLIPFLFGTDFEHKNAASFLFMILIVMILIVWAAYRNNKHVMCLLPFQKYFVPVVEGFLELISNRRVVILCALNFLICIILGGLRFYTIFMIFDSDMTVVGATLYFCINVASGMIPVLPGNIGIIEALLGVINNLMGNSYDVGVTVVMINRIYYYVVAIFGAVLFAYPSWKRYRNVIEKGEA